MKMIRVTYIAVIATMVYLLCMISLRAQIQSEGSGERDVAPPSVTEVTDPIPRDSEPEEKNSQATESFPGGVEDAFIDAAAMPDISGTWQLQENKDSFAKIRKSDEDGFDYELHWPVRGNGRPALKLKWHPTSNTFVATAPWPVEKASYDDAVYVVKAKWKNTRLSVTINLGEKAQKSYEKLREEANASNALLDTIWFPQMSFVKLELDTGDADPVEPARAPSVPAAEMPDISGTWNLQEYTNGYAQIRKLDEDDADFELHWPGHGQGRPSLKLKWLPKTQEFEGTAPWPLEKWAKGNAVYVVKAEGDKTLLDVKIDPDEKASAHYEKIAAKLKAGNASQDQIDGLLHPRWMKHVAVMFVQFGATDITESPPPQKQIEATDLLLLETEDGIAGYSKTLGTWDSVTVDSPKNGEGRLRNATVGQNFAVVIIDDQLFGYSAASGRWGQMTIPEEFLGKALPTVGLNLLSIQLGDTTYVFSPQTAKWTSPTEAAEAPKQEMPDISGRWELPEYDGEYCAIDRVLDNEEADFIVKIIQQLAGSGPPGLRLKWNAAQRHFEGQASWPMALMVKGRAKYVITPNDDASILNVDITLDEAAQQDFKVIAAKLDADRKSREKNIESGGLTIHLPIEDVLLHPQWHRTVSPELVKLFKGDSAATARPEKKPKQPDGPSIADADPPQPLATQIAAYEKSAAEIAGEIRAVVRKKLAGETVDEVRLGRLRVSLKTNLALALDRKLTLEQLQVEQLQSRLGRLEGLMDQRNSLRDQIIDRRMHELLDTDATKWDAEAVERLSSKQPDASQALPPGAITITIELYGGKNAVSNKELEKTLVPALLKLPGVGWNSHVAGEGDRFVMAVVLDPFNRTLKDRQLRAAINDILSAAGIEHIRWEVRPVPLPSFGAVPAPANSEHDVPTTKSEEFDSPLIAAKKEFAAAKLQWDELKPSNRPTTPRSVESRFAAKLKYDQSLDALRLAEEQHAALVRDIELQIESAQRQLVTAEKAAKFAETSFSVGASGIHPADIAEARLRRDQIELTLKRLQNRLDYLKKAASDGITIEAPSPPARAPEAAGQPAVAKAPLIDVRTTPVDDIGTRLATARNDVKVAEKALERGERLAAQNALSQSELETLRLQHDLAVRKLQAIEDEHAAALRDLELQIEAAELELKVAENVLQQADDSRKRVRGSIDDLSFDKLKLRRDQAALSLKRLQNRLAFLKKAGAEADEPPAENGKDEVSVNAATNPPPLTPEEKTERRFLLLTMNSDVIRDPRRLADFKHRAWISILGDRFTDDDLKPLADFEKMESLVLFDVNVNGPGLANLGYAKKLTSLSLIGSKATNQWLAHLPEMPQLKTLVIYDAAVTDDGLEHLHKFPNLTTLSVEETTVGENGLSGLRHLANLEWLNANNTPVAAGDLQVLENTPKLKMLNLKETQVTDDDLRILSRLPRLETFHLISPNVTGTGLTALRDLTKLKELSLYGESVTNEWLASLAPLRSVEILYLGSSQVTGEGFAAIRDWNNLKTLSIKDSPVDDSVVEHIADLYRLREINLYRTLMSPAAIEQLRKALPDAGIHYEPDAKKTVEAEEIDTPARKTSRRQIPDAAIQQSVEAFTTARDKLTKAKQELDRYEDLAERNAISTETIVGSRRQYVEAEKNLRLTQRWFDHVRSFIAMETFVNNEKLDAAQRTLENAKSKRDQGEITPEEFATYQSRYDHEEQVRKRLEHQADVFRQAIAGKENIASLSGAMESHNSRAFDDHVTYRDLFEKYAVGSKFDNPNLLPYLTDRWELSFVGEKFTDADLAQLAAMPRLSTLRLCDVNVSGLGLAELKKVKKLYRLELFGPRVTDEWLVQLPEMPKLQELRLVGSSITDAGLQQIEKFHWLHKLDLRETAIGDEGMKSLEFVPELQLLWLRNTQVSDEGLKYLSRVPHVAQFSLASPHVQGEGLSHLQTLNRLTNLQLTGSTADDKWMQAIAPLQHVVDFELHGTQVTSQGLAHLRGWKNLRRLYLNVNAQLDDDVIEHLQEISTLQVVELNGTQLTPEGLVRLRQALPNARIVCDAAEANEK